MARELITLSEPINVPVTSGGTIQFTYPAGLSADDFTDEGATISLGNNFFPGVGFFSLAFNGTGPIITLTNGASIAALQIARLGVFRILPVEGAAGGGGGDAEIIVEKTADFTPVDGEKGATFNVNAATAVRFTLPNTWAVGDKMKVRRVGAGSVAWRLAAGSTLTLSDSQQSHTGIASRSAQATFEVIANPGGASAVWGVSGETGQVPRFPAGVKLAAVGDSIMQRGFTAASAVARVSQANNSNSPIHWALARRPNFRHFNYWDPTATGANMVPTYAEGSATNKFYRGANFGEGGDTVEGVTRRLAQIIASGAKVCFINIGTNSETPNTAAERIAKLETILTTLVAADIHCVVSPPLPRWTGDMITVVDGIETVNASGLVTVTATAHDLPATGLDIYLLDSVIVNGIVLKEGYLDFAVTVVDPNTFTINVGGFAANASGTGLGGTWRFLTNRLTLNSGAVVDGFSDPPVDNSGSVRQLVLEDFANYIASLTNRYGVTVVDPRSVMIDAARNALVGTRMNAKKDHMADGVHIAPWGAMDYGYYAISPVLEKIIEGSHWFDPNPATSNLIGNGTLTGWPSFAGTGTSGSRPTDFNATWNVSTDTAVAGSVVANPDTGGQSWVLTISANGGGAGEAILTVTMPTIAAAGNLNIGDWVHGLFELEFEHDRAEIINACFAGLGPSGTQIGRAMHAMGGAQANEPLRKPYGDKIWYQIDPYEILTAVDQVPVLTIHVKRNVRGTAVLKLHRAIARKGIDPEAEFPWVA